jgi:two-component system chemotaxis response regulator CheB
MIKVLIVDDSAIVRKIITKELSKCKDIEIVGTAVDPYVAREKIAKFKPDVITLDLEMPKMDGLSFLAKLMQHYPIPVVVLSSLTPKNSQNALKALELGAVEVLCKPGASYSTNGIGKELERAIKVASIARVGAYNNAAVLSKNTCTSDFLTKTTNKIIAIGASTGGTKAIETVLKGLPSTSPGIVIAQHMPANFTASFAERLNNIVDLNVREARDNDHVGPGVALLAPGNYHMLLYRKGGTYMVKLKKGPLVHYQRPSVDVLFHSVAKAAGQNSIGVILTGMGTDGANGLLEMMNRGAISLAQDENTCVVYGMPKEAVKIGAVNKIIPLFDMSQEIINSLNSLD